MRLTGRDDACFSVSVFFQVALFDDVPAGRVFDRAE